MLFFFRFKIGPGIITIISCLNLALISESITVQTKSGKLNGVTRNSTKHAKVHEFLNIPYAKPPVGILRFEKPKSYGPWKGVLDATRPPPSCYQTNETLYEELVNRNVSEDCLYLNIYVPEPMSASDRRGVLIWIHGGSYAVGQAASYDGAPMAVTGGIIVVTINYRLNIFGFLSLHEKMGNFGLWDQRLAIQWVKGNIEAFGGDPKEITIAGESAGGFSVGLQAIAPINKGLFKRAILQSGAALSGYTMGIATRTLSKEAANIVGCEERNMDRLLVCMKNASAEDLYMAFNYLQSQIFLYLAFAPVVDGEFITDDPYSVMANKNSEASKFYRSLDVIIGTVSGESSLLVQILGAIGEEKLSFNITNGLTRNVLTDYIAPRVAEVMFGGGTQVTEAIIKKYSEGVVDDMEQTYKILDLYSDLLFDVPAVLSLRLHSLGQLKTGKQFQYVFSRESPKPLIDMPRWFNRSEHGAELFFLFTDLTEKSLDVATSDLILSEKMKEYWTNFVKSG